MSRLALGFLWTIMAFGCVAFAFMAVEFYVITVTGSTATYAKVLGWFVSENFAFGPESGFAQMSPHWRRMPAFNQVVLGLHAALCSVALVVGVFQFLPASRSRLTKWHRLGGRVYVLTALPGMVFSMIYLSITPMDKIYGGAPFAVGLWGIAILTTYTLLASCGHILRGEVVAHRATMVLNFSAMLIAPLLRFWWMFIGWVFLDYGVSQATAHVAVLMFIGLQVVVGAIVVLYFQSSRLVGSPGVNIEKLRDFVYQRLDYWVRGGVVLAIVATLVLLNPLLNLWHGQMNLFFELRDPMAWGRDLEVFSTHGIFFWGRALGLSGALFCAPLLFRQLCQTEESERLHALFPFVISVIVAVLCWLGLSHGYGMRGVGGVGASVFWGALATAATIFLGLFGHSFSRNDRRASREMTLHLFALCLAPVVQTLFQGLFLQLGFSFEEAFMAGAVVAPPLNLSFSFYYTAYSLRRLRRGSSSRAAEHQISLSSAVPCP